MSFYDWDVFFNGQKQKIRVILVHTDNKVTFSPASTSRMSVQQWLLTGSVAKIFTSLKSIGNTT